MRRVEEVVEVVSLFRDFELNVRAVTLSIPVVKGEPGDLAGVVESVARDFPGVVDSVADRLGVSVVTKRVAVPPVQAVLDARPDPRLVVGFAEALNSAASSVGVDYVGGLGAYADAGLSPGAKALVGALPDALRRASRVAAFLNVASVDSGASMDAVVAAANVVAGLGMGEAYRFTATVNAPRDTPYLPTSHVGPGWGELGIHVAISGVGALVAAARRARGSLTQLHDELMRASFSIARLGRLVGEEVARRLGIRVVSVDLSLAPQPGEVNSVARLFDELGVPIGVHGSVMAMALVADAVRRGGAAAAAWVGGFSEVFLPVSEDLELARAVAEGRVDIRVLELLSAICGAGVDMVVVERAPPDAYASIIGDVAAIGLVTGKPLGVRLIPVDAAPGTYVELGGLLGKAPVTSVGRYSAELVRRGGQLPPLRGLRWR